MSWGCTHLALTISEPRGEGTGTDKTVVDRVPCSWLGTPGCQSSKPGQVLNFVSCLASLVPGNTVNWLQSLLNW